MISGEKHVGKKSHTVCCLHSQNHEQFCVSGYLPNMIHYVLSSFLFIRAPLMECYTRVWKSFSIHWRGFFFAPLWSWRGECLFNNCEVSEPIQDLLGQCREGISAYLKAIQTDHVGTENRLLLLPVANIPFFLSVLTSFFLHCILKFVFFFFFRKAYRNLDLICHSLLLKLEKWEVIGR